MKVFVESPHEPGKTYSCRQFGDRLYRCGKCDKGVLVMVPVRNQGPKTCTHCSAKVVVKNGK